MMRRCTFVRFCSTGAPLLAHDPQKPCCVNVWARIGMGMIIVVVTGGCQDRPITADQLEPDGRLRAYAQASFSAEPQSTHHQAVHISTVLAAEASGPLQDRTRFPAQVGAVHLHVRADGLVDPRPVSYVWTYYGDPIEEHRSAGSLAPQASMSLGASFDIKPEQIGRWTVQVVTRDGPVRQLLEREFVVAPPNE